MILNIAAMRLLSQQLAAVKFDTPKDVVAWMGVIQAQDYAMSKWALGIRLPQTTELTIQNAIDNGEIFRTHLLRPTWHLVAAADINWMLTLTAPRIKAAMKSRHKELELTENILKKSNALIESALSGGKQFTREELTTLLKKAKIATNDNRLTHILLTAELEGIICNGVLKDKKQTYALLKERAPKIKLIQRDEALAILAKKYFQSHSPASLKDFVWWSGLAVNDARSAVELIKSNLVSEKFDSETYWIPNNFQLPKSTKPIVHLLPAFDEFIISYKNRAASLNHEHHAKAISNNGIFRPVILINGHVTGLWKRTIKKDMVIVEADLFKQHSKALKELITQAAVIYGNFLDKKTQIVFK